MNKAKRVTMTDLIDNASKMAAAGRKRSMNYGSTHTLTTVSTDTYNTPSSSSASSSEDGVDNNALQMHHLRIDMSSIDNNHSTTAGTNSSGDSNNTEISNLLTSNKERMMMQHHRSTDSLSFSDISSDGGGAGYYSRYARHRNKSRTARNFILKSVLTMNNFKVVLSFGYWFVSYMIMGIFGGSVAYLHFQRKDMDVPDPLPDFGYEAIPVSVLYLAILMATPFFVRCAKLTTKIKFMHIIYKRYSIGVRVYLTCHTAMFKALSCSFCTQ